MSAEGDFLLISLEVILGALWSVHVKGKKFQTQMGVISSIHVWRLSYLAWGDSAYDLTYIDLSVLEQTMQKVFVIHFILEWKYTEELNLLWIISQKGK